MSAKRFAHGAGYPPEMPMTDACTTSDLIHNRAFLGMLLLSTALVVGQFAWPASNVYLAPLLLASWGVFCTINAFRCGRVHCRITGPLCLVGAAALVMMTLGLMPISGEIFNLALLSGIVAAFLLERMIGRYGRRRPR